MSCRLQEVVVGTVAGGGVRELHGCILGSNLGGDGDTQKPFHGPCLFEFQNLGRIWIDNHVSKHEWFYKFRARFLALRPKLNSIGLSFISRSMISLQLGYVAWTRRRGSIAKLTRRDSSVHMFPAFSAVEQNRAVNTRPDK